MLDDDNIKQKLSNWKKNSKLIVCSMHRKNIFTCLVAIFLPRSLVEKITCESGNKVNQLYALPEILSHSRYLLSWCNHSQFSFYLITTVFLISASYLFDSSLFKRQRIVDSYRTKRHLIEMCWNFLALIAF